MTEESDLRTANGEIREHDILDIGSEILVIEKGGKEIHILDASTSVY